MKKYFMKSVSTAALVCIMSVSSFGVASVMADESIQVPKDAREFIRREIDENVRFGRFVSIENGEITIESGFNRGSIARRMPQGEGVERPEFEEGMEMPEKFVKRFELPEGVDISEKLEKLKTLEKSERSELLEGMRREKRPELVEGMDIPEITKKAEQFKLSEDIQLPELSEGDIIRLELDENGSVILIEVIPQQER